MRISTQEKLSYDDVLLRPQMSTIESRSAIDTSASLGAGIKLNIPIIASNMDKITGIKMAKKMSDLGGLGLLHRNDVNINVYSGYLAEWRRTHDSVLALSVGSVNRPQEKKRIDVILDLFSNDSNMLICIDIAHGHSENMLNTIRYIRNEKKYSGHLMTGAVCTYEGVQMMAEEGVDSVRVGVGPGSACSTRVKTGCGYPQFSAVVECSQVPGINIIADGGIREPGDAAKALAAGASAIMIGGVLAGTDCTPDWDAAWYQWQDHQKLYEDVQRPSVSFRGMASNAAKTHGGLEKGYEEGISTKVKIGDPGSTEDVIKKLVEGIKSSMSYCNARNLREFNKNADFVKVSSGVIHENHPHILSRV